MGIFHGGWIHIYIYTYIYIYVKQPTNNKTVTWISLVHESGALAALAMANSRLLLPKITWFTSENGKFTWLFDCRMKSSYISCFPVALCGGVVQLRQLAPPGPKSWEYEIWVMVLVRKNARHRLFRRTNLFCVFFFFSEGCVKGNVWMCLKIQHVSVRMAILGRLD